jgi:soluble lytic murein transglycosylase
LGALVNPVDRIKRLGSAKAESKGLKTDEADIFKFILRFSDQISTADAKKLAKLIGEECDNYSLDPFLILAMIYVESKFDPIAVSKKGAIGLMQVMPQTGEFIAEKLGIPFNGDKSLFDPVINVRLGIYYFSLLINRFDSIDQALIAYNVGPARFLNTTGLRKGPSLYVTRVLHFRSLLEDEGIITEES